MLDNWVAEVNANLDPHTQLHSPFRVIKELIIARDSGMQQAAALIRKLEDVYRYCFSNRSVSAVHTEPLPPPPPSSSSPAIPSGTVSAFSVSSIIVDHHDSDVESVCWLFDPPPIPYPSPPHPILA